MEPANVLTLFAHGVPTDLAGRVTIPTESGPVDIVSEPDVPITDALARRDFTIHAMAYDPREGALLDPFDGRADHAKGVLRCVGAADACFAADPLRIVRAARLVATHALAVEASIEPAMLRHAAALKRVPRRRIREELTLLLLADAVAEGLTLLRRGGAEKILAPGAADDAVVVVAKLPLELEVRMAGWLRGSRASSVLRRLRFPRASVARVERLLRHHPVEAALKGPRDVSVRRLLRRAGRDLPALMALREAELTVRAEGRERLEKLKTAIDRVRRMDELAQRRTKLALDGAEVMSILGCGPGPDVGRALRYLAEAILADPSRNDPGVLRELLDRWRDG